MKGRASGFIYTSTALASNSEEDQDRPGPSHSHRPGLGSESVVPRASECEYLSSDTASRGPPV